MMIRKKTIFPILLAVGIILVTTRSNWKLLQQHIFVSSTREILAEELSFRMPSSSSWKLYNNHPVLVNLTTVISSNSTSAIESSTNFTKYYFLHIPKAGGNSMRDALNRNGACVIDTGPRQHIRHFTNWTLQNPQYRVFMSEGLGFNEEPPPQHNNFVMFRDPTSHVLSQYFHCTESRDTQKRRARLNRMPKTLYEWLQIWEETRQKRPLAKRKSTHNADMHWTDPRMRCYNPIDFQSWITGYPQSKQDLTEKFNTIGILSEFHLSSCIFSTMILNRVPQVCDCSHQHSILWMNDNRLNATISTTRKSNHHDNGIGNNSDNINGTRKMHNGHSHGVTHHGDSYQPSDKELQLIRNLTMHDQILYNNAKDIFHAQVAAMERQYQVKFCSADPITKQKQRRGHCAPL